MWLRGNRTTPVVPVKVIMGDFSDGRVEPVRGIRLLAVSAVVIILSASASVYALSGHAKPATEAPTAAEIVQANAVTAGQPIAPTNSTPAKAVASSRAVTPSCTRGIDPTPTAISLPDSASDVILQSDSSNSYRVYGNSTSEIWSQINRCSPVRSGGVFAADTSYRLDYVYRFMVGADGQCRVASAAVGMHTSQVFPVWSPTSTTPDSTTARWNAFSTALHAHENGHVALDNSYAQKLYAALMATQPTANCATLQANVNAAASNLQAQLDAANNAYDAATGHGRTQGAVL
jgi:predicted secreted Zn-dependent protease